MAKTTSKKTLSTLLVVVLVAVVAIGGMLAYLTDRDSEVNTFTVGDVAIDLVEDYDQGSKLLPGVDVEKKAHIENTGTNDAYVWMTVAIPADVDSAIEMNEFDANWDASAVDMKKETINGKEFNVYTYLYKNALPAGKATGLGLEKVYLNQNVDYVDGKYYMVENGVATEVEGDVAEAVIYVSAYAIQKENFDNVKDAYDAYQGQWGDKGTEYAGVTMVYDGEEFEEAIAAAEDGDVITLGANIEEDVVLVQKADTEVTIDGNNKTIAGVITVDGKSETIKTAGLTIKNVNFKADSISADACIQLGNGTNATRYTCNVTVDGCTFDVPGAVGVKSYTGGDKNLVIKNCVATANAHSLVQAKGIDGILVKDCKVYSKNGLNFNNSDNVTVDGCDVDVKGYAVRFGESSGGSGAAETYLIKNCTLKSANDDGDATIILRGTADYSTLTIENTEIIGTPNITNTATGATVIK